MSRERFVRRVALGAMTLVTAAALWGWTQPARGAQARDSNGSRAPSAAGQASPAEGSGEGDSAEAGAPEPINWADFGSKTPPFVAVLVNFAILVGAYYALGKKPIAAALQSRRDSIAKDIEEAERAKAAAEERAKVYQGKLEKLEDEVRAAREALVRAGEAERERIVSDAEAKAERLRSDAQFLVEQELKQVREDLLREAVEAAVAGAQALLTARVTAADQERLAEDYLASLGAHKGPAAEKSESAERTS